MTLFPHNLAFAEQMLPIDTYRTLRRSLWQVAHRSESWCLTEADLEFSSPDCREWLLVVSPTTQGILVHRSDDAPVDSEASQATQCLVGLITDPAEVAAAMQHLLARPCQPPFISNSRPHNSDSAIAPPPPVPNSS